MKSASAADAARRQSEHDLGTHAEAFQSAVQRMGSATATSVIWVGHESPSLEVGAGRPVRRRDHYHAPNRSAPYSTGRPLRSVAPATPPTDCGSPQTKAAAAVRGPEQERQIAAQRSGLEPRTDRSPQWRPHGYTGMSASSGMAVYGAGSCTSKRSIPRPRSRASAVRREFAERPTMGSPGSFVG